MTNNGTTEVKMTNAKKVEEIATLVGKIITAENYPRAPFLAPWLGCVAERLDRFAMTGCYGSHADVERDLRWTRNEVEFHLARMEAR